MELNIHNLLAQLKVKHNGNDDYWHAARSVEFLFSVLAEQAVTKEPTAVHSITRDRAMALRNVLGTMVAVLDKALSSTYSSTPAQS